MKAEDVTATLDLALQASGLDQAGVVHRPRLMSDNGSSYVSADLAKWLDGQDMDHVRGAPYACLLTAKSCRRVGCARHLSLRPRMSANSHVAELAQNDAVPSSGRLVEAHAGDEVLLPYQLHFQALSAWELEGEPKG